MIKLILDADEMNDLQEGAYVKWGFSREEGSRLTAALSPEDLEEFLKENNLILYKNHIKAYQDGSILGEISVD